MGYDERIVRDFLGDLIGDLEREAYNKAYGRTTEAMRNTAIVHDLCSRIDRKLEERFGENKPEELA